MPRASIPVQRVAADRRRIVLPPGFDSVTCLLGDGIDDYVQGSNPLSGSTGCTLLAWVYVARDTSGVQRVIHAGTDATNQAYWLGVSGTGSAFVFGGGLHGTTNVQTPVVARPGWRRIFYRHPPGDSQDSVGVDGVVLNTNSSSSTPAIAGTVARLLRSAGGSFPFAGMISDARIYNRDLTDAEIAADFRGEFISNGIVRWWPCVKIGSGTTCHEEIGGTNDTISGAIWSELPPRRHRTRVSESQYAVGLFNATNISAAMAPYDASCGVMLWIKHTQARSQQGPAALSSTSTPYQYLWFPYSFSLGRQAVTYITDGVTGKGCGASFYPQTNFDYIHRNWWRHLAACYDRSTNTISIYVDGVLSNTATMAGVGSLDRVNQLIPGSGGDLCAASDLIYRKGAIFTASEVKAAYRGMIPSCPPGANQWYWPANEGSGTAKCVAMGPDAGVDLNVTTWRPGRGVRRAA